MSVAVLAPPPPERGEKLSVEDYLLLERTSEIRHEFVEGEIIPMAGSTPQHNVIAGNIHTLLNIAFQERDCTVYMSDIRLRVSPQRYRYPDVIAVCGTPRFDLETPPCLLNPNVVVEVLSSSTAQTDWIDKSREYRSLPSVTDFVLVSANRRFVTHLSRQDAETWTLKDHSSADAVLDFGGIEVTLTLADLYRKVTFLEPTEA